jgi:hypothetical protein
MTETILKNIIETAYGDIMDGTKERILSQSANISYATK